MPLSRRRRQYEQLSEFERGRVIGMMKAGWSARDASRFNLSIDDNHARVWRPRGEHLHPAFALQRHTTPSAGVMGHLGRQVGQPLSLVELKLRLQQLWNEMPQDIIRSLYAAMPARITSHIRVRGGKTEY
ncbi:uncharacterized protein TNCV_2862761 [Trichonephila clavipes]|nr:uncharacterized protein TNCV_2862761 [Trichonephila clavipes]